MQVTHLRVGEELFGSLFHFVGSLMPWVKQCDISGAAAASWLAGFFLYHGLTNLVDSGKFRPVDQNCLYRKDILYNSTSTYCIVYYNTFFIILDTRMSCFIQGWLSNILSFNLVWRRVRAL